MTQSKVWMQMLQSEKDPEVVEDVKGEDLRKLEST